MLSRLAARRPLLDAASLEPMGNAVRREWDRTAYIRIRRRRDEALRPLSSLLSRCGVTAPMISLLGVALAALACWSVGRAPAGIALAAFLAALLADAMDGALARQSGTDGPAGKVVDHACDTATFLLVLLAVARSDLASAAEVSASALLAVPLLLVAIQARRRRSPLSPELSGGFLAHVYKVPIYGAFLIFTAGGGNLLPGAVKLANITAALSLVLLVAGMLRAPRATAGRAAAEPRG